MRPVVVAASLLVAGWLFAPARADAQEPGTPPPPPAEVAVPRAPAAPADAGKNRAPEHAVERPVREPGQPTGASRREVITMSNDTAVPRAANTDSTTAATDEEGQRRGSVRRPPGGGSGDRGRDRAVPRSQAPPPPRTTIFRSAPYRHYPNYSLYYDPWGYGSFGLGYFYYSPWSWSPYGVYGYGPYGYSYPRYAGGLGFDVGSVKLKVRPRDAEVWVDGYYAGIVDDFDGVFQALRLDSGPYHIEIRKPGFETLSFDVRVQPERTITFRGDLRPVP